MEQAKITCTPDAAYQVVWPDGRAWTLFVSCADLEVIPQRSYLLDGTPVATIDVADARAFCKKFHKGANPADLEDWICENNELQTVYTCGRALDEIQAVIDKLSTKEARILLQTALDLIGAI